MSNQKKALFIGIQSRLNSSRFPYKACAPILGIPLIIHVIKRMQTFSFPHTLALLTPINEKKTFAQLLRKYNISTPIFGGSEHNVLERYIKACKYFNAKDLIMRVTGDNPLISIPLAEELFQLHERSRCDLSHFLENPTGTGVEIISYDALEISSKNSRSQFEQEHVTQYIYKNRKIFHILEPICRPMKIKIKNLSVDYPKDLVIINKLLSQNQLWDISDYYI